MSARRPPPPQPLPSSSRHPNLGRDSVEAIQRGHGAISAARTLLRVWRHSNDDAYAAAGRDAITRINEALTHLEHARAALFAEIAAVAEILAADDEPAAHTESTEDAA